jgi:hypothetical protein
MKFRIVFRDVLPFKMIVDNYFTGQYIPEDNSELHEVGYLSIHQIFFISVNGLTKNAESPVASSDRQTSSPFAEDSIKKFQLKFSFCNVILLSVFYFPVSSLIHCRWITKLVAD